MDEFEDEQLFDEIYEYADECPWFDKTQFVDDVYAQFQSRRRITSNQRDVLTSIRDMLEEKASD
jgi:hypothetical protein